MSKRKVNFVNGEIYHVYNRGVEKRDIFVDQNDCQRFFKSVESLNVIEPIGSLKDLSFVKDEIEKEPLVEFIVYAIMPNHYHFLMRQLIDGGITKFMQKFATAYTNYFNERYRRSGGLFQGKFKSIHVDTNEYLLYLSSYINLNDKIKPVGSKAPDWKSEFIFTSWESYVGDGVELIPLEKSIVVDQFKNKREYEKFALSVSDSVRENKLLQSELKLDGLI